MKKLTSLFCALTVMLGANAISRIPAAGQDASTITLKANQGVLYNMAGTDDETFISGKAMDGIMRLDLALLEDGKQKTNFSAYFYNETMSSLNGIFRLGINYTPDEGDPFDLYTTQIDVAGDGNKFENLTNAYMQASLIGVKNVNGADQKIYDILIESDQYVFTLQVPVLGINKVEYDADPAKGVFHPTDQAYLFDEETAVFDGAYTDDQLTLFIDDDPKVLYLEGKIENRHRIMLKFNVDHVESGTYIPAGTYTIDKTGNAGTVSASAGYEAGNMLPSYVETYALNDGKYLPDKDWFLKSGTVKVETDGTNIKVTVDARNFYGKAVKATLGSISTSTALDDVVLDRAVTKTVENGQLVIIRNGVRYNAQGAVVE